MHDDVAKYDYKHKYSKSVNNPIISIFLAIILGIDVMGNIFLIWYIHLSSGLFSL